MDEHDKALEWAQQNPDDPRSQDIQAKAWASKNPNDPRSVQILQKLAPNSVSAGEKAALIADPSGKYGALAAYNQATTPEGVQGLAAASILPGGAQKAGEALSSLKGLLQKANPKEVAITLLEKGPRRSLVDYLKGGLKQALSQPEAAQAEQSVIKKAVPAANKGWDFPVR